MSLCEINYTLHQWAIRETVVYRASGTETKLQRRFAELRGQKREK